MIKLTKQGVKGNRARLKWLWRLEGEPSQDTDEDLEFSVNLVLQMKGRR